MIVSVDEALKRTRTMGQVKLIAIDGLPCAGKSLLAKKLTNDDLSRIVPIDDFFLPQASWPPDIRPAFPFPFYRYGTFLQTIKQLAERGTCNYLPFDWDVMEVSGQPRVVDLKLGTVVVEGTSCLHPELTPLYDLRFFVESDAATMLEAILERDGLYFQTQWSELWLPSVEQYMESKPQGRAHYRVEGRGALASDAGYSHI